MKYRIIPLLYGFFVLCIILAFLFYPSDLNFSVFTHTFSRLGDWQQNPRGWIFFTIALIWIGFGLIPVTGYLIRSLRLISPFFAFLIRVSSILGVLGLIGTGLFADIAGVPIWPAIWPALTYRGMHNYVTIFAMGGTGLMMIWIGVVLLIDKIPRLGGVRLVPVVPPLIAFILFLGAAIGLGIAQIIRVSLGLPFADAGNRYFAPWEWVTITALFIAQALLIGSIDPNRVESQRNAKNQSKNKII
jgi:hypothetical protein